MIERQAFLLDFAVRSPCSGMGYLPDGIGRLDL